MILRVLVTCARSVLLRYAYQLLRVKYGVTGTSLFRKMSKRYVMLRCFDGITTHSTHGIIRWSTDANNIVAPAIIGKWIESIARWTRSFACRCWNYATCCDCNLCSRRSHVLQVMNKIQIINFYLETINQI